MKGWIKENGFILAKAVGALNFFSLQLKAGGATHI